MDAEDEKEAKSMQHDRSDTCKTRSSISLDEDDNKSDSLDDIKVEQKQEDDPKDKEHIYSLNVKSPSLFDMNVTQTLIEVDGNHTRNSSIISCEYRSPEQIRKSSIDTAVVLDTVTNGIYNQALHTPSLNVMSSSGYDGITSSSNITWGSLNSISTINDNDEPQIMPQIKQRINDPSEDTEISQLSGINSRSEGNNGIDIILPFEHILPTKPEMKAPRPMQNMSLKIQIPKRRHSYNQCLSRTDLAIDASGDETTSGSDEENFIHQALESSGSDDLDLDESMNDLFENNADDISPSPIKNMPNISTIPLRSCQVHDELQQRRTAMDSHYVIPHYYKSYVLWYFALFILILFVTIICIGSSTLDKSQKYVNMPRYNKHWFLRDICTENNSNSNSMYIADKEYLMSYGYQYVDTKYYSKYNDGIHWIILSVIGIGFGMIICYPLMLLFWSALLIFRDKYYKKHGIDPLFCCKFCSIHRRYSSPNAPYLSSVLDPNNLYLFNHTISPGISPNAITASKCPQKIKLATVVVNECKEEKVFFSKRESMLNDSDSNHSMGVEPPSPINNDNDKSESSSVRNGDEEDIDDNSFGILRETLLDLKGNNPLSNPIVYDSSRANQDDYTCSYVE